MSRLLDLALKYGTDKASQHNYIPNYESYLVKDIDALLEIGCFKGASVKMWKDYYGEKTEIHTIDLFAHSENISKEEIEKFGIVAHKGNQADIEFLYKIKNQFDVIIDDGSHNSDQQIISFKHLFLNNLKSGGLYVIEDLHCCNECFFWGVITNFNDTALATLKRFNQAGSSIKGALFNDEETTLFTDSISSVEIFDDKIAFIHKK